MSGASGDHRGAPCLRTILACERQRRLCECLRAEVLPVTEGEFGLGDLDGR